jgi:hypothetical protein
VATAQTARTRAKDSDRTDTCQILDTALAEGQLSMAEHGERVKAATNAATLGELRALVSDLQTRNAPVQLPTLRTPMAGSPARWGLRLAAAGALVLLGVGIGWGFSGGGGSPFGRAPDPGAQPDGVAPVVLTPPRQLHSLGGLNGLFEQMRTRFGDTAGYRMVIYPDYAVLVRSDRADDRRTLSYTYRGGWDDPSTGAKDREAVAVDLAKFDTATIVGVLRGAAVTLNIKPADVTSTYLTLDPSGDPGTPAGLEISVYVSSDFGSGYIALNPDGSIKRISYP